VFVSIDADGGLRIERGYVRREDEAPVETVEGGTVAGTDPVAGVGPDAAGPHRGSRIIVSVIGGDASSEPQGDAEEEDGIKPLSERLVIELTAHRTLALRDALANDPGTAFTAVLHALCLGAFYRMTFGTCLEISAKSASFSAQAPGLATALPPRRSKPVTGTGPRSCPSTKTNCGTRWLVRRRPSSGAAGALRVAQRQRRV